MEEMLDVLPTEGVASVAQYLLCTQASNQSSSHRIQGLTVLSTQSLAMAVLPSGRCALLPLPLALLQLDTPSPLVHFDEKKPAKVVFYRNIDLCRILILLFLQTAGDENAFVELVKRTLSHSASQPLVMLPPAASPSNKELLEVLSFFLLNSFFSS
jgi:Nuclear pore component